MQSCWRWDWGPELLTMGPDRAIILHMSTLTVNPWVRSEVDENLIPHLSLDLGLSVSVLPEQKVEAEVVLTSLAPEQRQIKSERKEITGTGEMFVDWDLHNLVDLWWPNGSGTPHRYQLDIILFDSVSPSLSHFNLAPN
jgi:beta-mannosidase